MFLNVTNREKVRSLFGMYLFRRLEQVRDDFSRTRGYRELTKKEDEAFEKLREALPGDLKQVLIEYSDILNQIMLDQHEYFYKQGFRDCCRFFK